MTDTHGPIDFLLLEFSGDHDLGPIAAALVELIERGTVSLYDLVAIEKHDDGSYTIIELEGLGDDVYFLSGARSGLLGDDDLREASDALLPGTTAMLVMYENLWAIPFVAAALEAGGTLVASQRIPAEDVIAVLDELDVADRPAD